MSELSERIRQRLIGRAYRTHSAYPSGYFESMTLKELRHWVNYTRASVTEGRGYRLAIEAYGFEGFIQRVRDARLYNEDASLRTGIATVIKDARRATRRAK